MKVWNFYLVCYIIINNIVNKPNSNTTGMLKNFLYMQVIMAFLTLPSRDDTQALVSNICWTMATP
jgi:hypothetical protein